MSSLSTGVWFYLFFFFPKLGIRTDVKLESTMREMHSVFCLGLYKPHYSEWRIRMGATASWASILMSRSIFYSDNIQKLTLFFLLHYFFLPTGVPRRTYHPHWDTQRGQARATQQLLCISIWNVIVKESSNRWRRGLLSNKEKVGLFFSILQRYTQSAQWDQVGK